MQHPKINNKYILITHNSDKKIGLSEKELKAEKYNSIEGKFKTALKKCFL